MPKPENVAPHQFPKGKSGNPKGRPKKGVSAVLSSLEAAGHAEVTAEQVRATMSRMLNLPREELVKMGNDAKGTPILDALIARSLAGKDGWQAMQDILDRAHGKAKQQVDLTGAGAIPVPTVTVVVQAVTPNGGQG